MLENVGEAEKSTSWSTPLSQFTLEANRTGKGMGLFIGGVVGISDFSDTSILLKSHGCRVVVEGKRLTLKIYENNCVEINGRVEDIKFVYGKS